MAGESISGIFIKKVQPDSPAGRCGQLLVGDRILRINDMDLNSSDQSVAVGAIRSAGDSIRFVVQSFQVVPDSARQSVSLL